MRSIRSNHTRQRKCLQSCAKRTCHSGCGRWCWLDCIWSRHNTVEATRTGAEECGKPDAGTSCSSFWPCHNRSVRTDTCQHSSWWRGHVARGSKTNAEYPCWPGINIPLTMMKPSERESYITSGAYQPRNLNQLHPHIEYKTSLSWAWRPVIRHDPVQPRLFWPADLKFGWQVSSQSATCSSLQPEQTVM